MDRDKECRVSDDGIQRVRHDDMRVSEQKARLAVLITTRRQHSRTHVDVGHCEKTGLVERMGDEGERTRHGLQAPAF